MKKMDLLSASLVYSLNENKIDLFKEHSPVANFTDYALFSINNQFMNRKGKWWLKSGDGEGNVDVVCEDGKYYTYEADNPCIGTRPIINYSIIKNELSNVKKNELGLLEGEWGEYIQKLVSYEEQKTLEQLYLNNEISYTGKEYNIIMPCSYIASCIVPLELKQSLEYIYNNRKFVRVETNNHIKWFEVLPVKWLISVKYDTMITKDIIIGRMPIQLNDEYYLGPNLFEYTDMYKYLNEKLLKELVTSQKINNKTLKKL